MTRLVKMSEAEIEEAARLVLAGGLVAYPTDTVYGLGCNPFDLDAVERLVRAKQRVKGALPVLVSSLAHARKLGEFDPASLGLARRFWPGPLTLVVPARKALSARVTGNTPFVGLRIPKFQETEQFIEECGGSIIGTSANISGHISPKTVDMVISELGGRIDLVLDGGQVPLGRESTVVKAFRDEVTVIREGAISKDDILKTVNASRAIQAG